MRLSEKIPMLVKRMGITQAELARAIGTYPSRISEWASEEGKPSIQQALRMARALNVSLDYLADDAQDDPPQMLSSEWERKVWEIVKEIGAEAAWKKLVRPDQGGSGIEYVTPEAPKTPPKVNRKGTG
jgi:transcriptional regulator with XRE-family HTH domain